MNLQAQIAAYTAKDIAPFHTPGHKRQGAWLTACPTTIDITELPGFDNLHNPTGILRDLEQSAAHLFQCADAYPLVNGATAGILAAIYATVSNGDRVLVARNAHQSVYHALELTGAIPVMLTPPVMPNTGLCGSISADAVADVLAQHPDIRLAVITSPTYEGIVSDIASIAAVLHAKNIPLLVDEAHGAHLGITDHFPNSAANKADLTVKSLHKTLPSLTQTAMLLRQGPRVSDHRLRHALSIFQTSSPSYILLASIDQCINHLTQQGAALFSAWHGRLTRLHAAASAFPNFPLLTQDTCPTHIWGFDESKITILCHTASLDGHALHNALRERHSIELEMSLPTHAIAMTSPMTTDAHITRLIAALTALNAPKNCPAAEHPPLPDMISGMPMQSALCAPGVPQMLSKSIGKIAKGYVWAYPPGVPIVIPGTRITEHTVEYLQAISVSGGALHHTFPAEPGNIVVVDK